MTVEAVAAGRYEVERTLGHGGMATVYLARDVELDRPVAVKVLADQIAGDTAFRTRFLREATLAARLSHPNVVGVYDAGEEDGVPFIVMEYVEGETVADRLRRGKPPPAEAAEIARQAALGLGHAHAAGLVHRDVKPQNLLVRTDGVVKIADFGIARAAELSRLTQLGTVLGTAAYLSPEQALGGEVGPPADVYSLGAVLYELLTGRPPFEFASLAELAEKQRSGEIVPVRDLEPAVPDDLEAIVMQCLAREPAFRPASAGELAAALAHEPETVPLPVAPAATVPQRRVFQRVHGARGWVWIAAAAVVVAVALALGLARLGGGGSSHGGSSPPPTQRIRSVPQGATPAQAARNLSRWLRTNARR